ncbi:MAG TPA: NAD(P)/FAD-dependent oxidoreductase [Candidatus Binatus sp.]|nr:NAD(P)/FAD-dependent oxidoreductase [Candidatus Binatus sp.]
MERHDVAVIGAGLAGLWCARALARRGVDVLLVDARQDVGCNIRTTGIFVRRTRDDFDLPRAVFGASIRRVVLHSPRGRAVAFERDAPEFWIADMAALYQSLLADAIRAGARWRPGFRFIGLRAGPDSSIVVLRRGGAADERVRARLIVGADGARSRVAAELGLDRNSDFLLGLEDVHSDVALATPPVLHCVLSQMLAPGYIAWVAHAGIHAHVGVAGDALRFQPRRSLERVTRIARTLLPSLKTQPDSDFERRGGLIPCGGVLRRIGCDRGLLVGDAAGAVSPLTAGGLDGSIRLSEFASRLIVERLAGVRGALSAYDGGRFQTRFIARRWMRGLLRMSTDSLLELACTALATPLARRFGEHVFFGRGSFPDVDVRIPRSAPIHRLAR